MAFWVLTLLSLITISAGIHVNFYEYRSFCRIQR